MIIEKNGRFFIQNKDGKNVGLKKGYETEDEAINRGDQIEFFNAENKNCRVNVRSTLHCNAAAIAEKEFEGVPHIIIQGAKHMIGDSVMNGILYPSESMRTLNSELTNADRYVSAPVGHPIINGNYGSAEDPRSLIRHSIGAFHYNWRVENDRLMSDTAINPEVAKMSEDGRELLRRINEEEDVDISTGFYLDGVFDKGVSANGEDYEMTANYLILDHSAILINEPGAKTSSEGVGLFANDSKGGKIPAMDCLLDDAKQVELSEISKTLMDHLKTNDLAGFVKSLFSSNNKILLPLKQLSAEHLKLNQENEDMKDLILNKLKAAGVTTDGLSDDQLMAEYDKLKANDSDDSGKLAETVTQAVNTAVAKEVKPLQEEITKLKDELENNSKADREEHIKLIVANTSLNISEEIAKTMPDDALAALAANSKSVDNASGGSFQVNEDDGKEFDEMSAPGGDE